MGRFKGQTIPLGGPERLLPTESTGIDLREARSMNRPPRDDRFDDRGPRRFDREDRGGFEDRPRRTFRDREEDDGPRRTTSRRTEDSSRAEEEEDWRAGAPSRAPSGGMRRFESDSAPERRASTRRSEEDTTAADLEDDWRAGGPSRSSTFTERRGGAASSGGFRRDDDDSGPRRFSSRREESTRADDDDWRKGGADDNGAPTRIERTRSFRPSIKPAGPGDDEDDWRTPATSNSATPWARKTSASGTPGRTAAPAMAGRRLDTTSSPTATKKAVAPAAAAAPVVAAEADWSSSSDSEAEPAEAKPDMEKISKFVEKLASYVADKEVKKIDSIVKKIPINFGAPELNCLEPMKAVLNLVLNKDITDAGEKSIVASFSLIAPVIVCLEQHYPSTEEFQMNVLEHVQVFANGLGLPRISAETALIEQIWIALYESQIVAEEVFQMWLDNDHLESPGKGNTLFQTEAFRAWLYDLELPGVEATMKRTAATADAHDEWSDSDSDIEALVPKRISTAGINLRSGAVAPLRR